jgi:hypothetical protein
MPQESSSTGPVPNELIAAFFDHHERIEPGEELTEQVLVVPNLNENEGFPMAYQVRASIVGSRRWSLRRPIVWTANTVIYSPVLQSEDGSISLDSDT